MSRPENTLQFLGAAETVTGSRFLIEAGDKRILVDCGLFQGYKNLRLRNWKPFPVPPNSIDVVLLTHAHLDHSGYVPALVREGFKGDVLVTAGTAELCKTLWPDSAYLLEEEAERANRKGYTKHKPARPIYDSQDVVNALKQLRIVEFDETLELFESVTAQFIAAGHILGAAQVRVSVNGTTVHFTGDLGRDDDPLMLPPAAYPGSDILVVESTYGDRNHPEIDPEAELGEPLKRVLERGGTVVIPAFAIGRSQSLLLHIWHLMEKKA
jgi:metallo-beta-lactamase family protein